MAIRITEDGVVIYENSPDVNRKLFPNLNICGKEIDELADEIDGKAPVVFSTASGSIASFSDGADDMPLKSCVVNIEPIQEGSGDPSPDNVRPISGRTELTVFHSGVETIDPTTISVNWESEAGTVYGGTLDVVSGKLTVDRVLVNSDANSDFGKGARTDMDEFFLRVTDTGVSGLLYGSEYVICNYAKNVESDDTAVTYARMFNGQPRINFPLSLGINSLALLKTWLSEQGSPLQFCYKVATPTEIQLAPQEVRTLLGVNNVWSDGGDISVEYPADTKTYIDAKVAPVQDVQVNGASILDAQGVANVPVASGTMSLGLVKTSAIYGLRADRDGTLYLTGASGDEIKNGTHKYNPVTPYTANACAFYGLAKAAGDTTQSASSNAVGTYTEDAKTAIQIMLGISNIIGVVEGTTASTAYSVGDLFLHSGALYKATAAIASGDAIVPGTNCEQTTIIDILKGA